jgi:hypothetical protein
MSETVYYDKNYKIKDSSSLSEVWYSTAEKRLFVKFVSTGTVAGYKNVPAYVFSDFESHIASPYKSAGSYYARNIKPLYAGTTSDVNLVHVSNKAVAFGTQTTGANVSRLTFNVTGYVPISISVQANTLEEAIEEFKRRYKDGRVTEAGVKF